MPQPQYTAADAWSLCEKLNDLLLSPGESAVLAALIEGRCGPPAEVEPYRHGLTEQAPGSIRVRGPGGTVVTYKFYPAWPK